VGERDEIGKASQEALVVRNHGADLRLLQHDLGQPDAIRIARVLPGQVLAPMHSLPGDHLRREVFAWRYPAAVHRSRSLSRCLSCSSGFSLRGAASLWFALPVPPLLGGGAALPPSSSCSLVRAASFNAALPASFAACSCSFVASRTIRLNSTL